MRKDELDTLNWTSRQRWSPRNLGTYGVATDSNTPDVPASEPREPLERWHNREFYGQSEGYMTMREAGVHESTLPPAAGTHDAQSDLKITS